MEGFLDIKLPVWKRVTLTRLIAILPALSVSFMDKFDEMDTYLNILQSIQLPFAMIPLLVFASSPKIMGQFAIPLHLIVLSIALASLLIMLNMIDMFMDLETTLQYILMTLAAIIYLGICAFILTRDISKLEEAPELTQEEKEQQINVDSV